MKANSAWFLGVPTTIIGWIWMVFGTGKNVDRFGPTVFNIHIGTMAELLCQLGYSLMIIGAIISAATFLADKLVNSAPVTPNNQLQAPQLTPEEPDNPIDMSNLPTGKTMAQRREEALRTIHHGKSRPSLL